MKKFIAMPLALVMVLSLVACGDKKDDAAGTDDSDKDSQDTITLKMHFVDPETAPFVQGGKKIAELVSEATDGRIQIEVLAGGSLGGERDTVELAMDNSLDIATCANSVLTNFIPEMGILDQAYLWKNADEAHAAVDGKLGDLIKEKAEALGLHIIGPRATDLISEGALALRLEATLDELITTIHSHPTVTETVREAALHAEGRAIHTKN